MAILDSSHVFFDCAATSCDEVLSFVADKAAELGATTDAAALLAGLKAREGEGSTGMQGGFAIPHCKSSVVSEPCIIVVRLANPVAWETMDKSEVTCAIALLIPDGDKGTEHLRILSKIAAALLQESFCETVRSATDAAQIVAAINEGLEN